MAGTWTVPATVVEVVDGVTVTLELALGWDVWTRRTCRLIGCVAPDPGTDEGAAAVRRLKGFLGSVDASALVFVSHDYGPDGIAAGRLFGSTGQGTMIDISAEMMPQ